MNTIPPHARGGAGPHPSSDMLMVQQRGCAWSGTGAARTSTRDLRLSEQGRCGFPQDDANAASMHRRLGTHLQPGHAALQQQKLKYFF